MARAVVWPHQDTSVAASFTSQIESITREVSSVIASATSAAAASSSSLVSSSAFASSSSAQASASASSLASSTEVSTQSYSTLTTTVPATPVPTATSNTSSVSAFPATTAPSSAVTSIVSPTPATSPSTVSRPTGGIGYDTIPAYKPTSDYDFQSINLALHQALMEQALLQFGNANFSSDNLSAAGLSAEQQKLLPYMTEQQVGQVDLLSNILYPNVTQPCTYAFPAFNDAREFVDFATKALRFGESGMLGFLSHLDAQDSASLLQGTLAVKSRQQMLFRQLEGLFPIPFDFAPAITQNMQFSLLAPYISSCPSGNPSVKWDVYPTLRIQNNPYFPDIPLVSTNAPAVSNDPTTVTYGGRELILGWDAPGTPTGPNGSFTTKSSAGGAKARPSFLLQYVAWISQLNTTYTPLTLANDTNPSANTTSGLNGTTIQPFLTVFANTSIPLLNGTVFVLITDEAIAVTPYNLSQIEAHIVAGPALYTVG
ncbi:hypothetical protein OF83DRAFT_1069622 [Amylostereum chailletii]|nr:hypothetical protein OF83DRAFT_1069622 [Amylostereum chailletii]